MQGLVPQYSNDLLEPYSPLRSFDLLRKCCVSRPHLILEPGGGGGEEGV